MEIQRIAEGEAREEFLELISAMDEEYIEHAHKQATARAAKGK